MAHRAGDVNARLPILLACASLSGLAFAAPPQSARPTPKSTVKGPSALDKKQFEFYVRHLFVWPDAITVHVGDPKPSPIPGFLEVDVNAAQGKASQDEKFFVSKDGRQVIRGFVYAVKDNPFRDQLSKIKTEGHPGLGTPGAPVVIAEFSDFQCHFCKEEAKVFRESLIKQYPTQVHFFFMDNPLEGLHPWARAAAIAGRCVYRQKESAFWNYHDWIFGHQEEITPENLKEKVLDWAKTNEVDATAMSACMAGKEAEKEVNASISMARALSVNSTPTTFINGRPMVGATPWADLKTIIDFEIGYQETVHDAGENCGCDQGLRKLGVN